MHTALPDDIDGPEAEGLRAIVALHRDARERDASVLVVLHSPYGGGAEPLVKHWRRYLMTENTAMFEARCGAAGGTYQPIRDLLGGHVRTLDSIGGLDDQVSELVAQVGGSLGLPSAGTLATTTGAGDASASHQLRFFDVLGRVFVELSKRLPATFLVQDLHAADSATRAAMEYLFRNVVTDPVQRFAPPGRSARFRGTVVVTVSGSEPEVAALRTSIERVDNAHWVSLRALEETRVRDYLGTQDVVERLTAASGGSVDELAELLRQLPGKVEDLYMRRIERLERADRRVLEVLAVINAPTRPDFLLRVAEDAGSVPSLASLADQRLIVRQVARGELLVAFPTVTNRRAVYAAIPTSRRTVIHGRIAAILEERLRLGASADLGVLAWHYLNSNVREKAYQFALEAAERLHISFAYGRARDLLESLLPSLSDASERAVVLTRLVELSSALNEHEAALAHSRALLEVAEAQTHAAILCNQARILREMGSYDEALERLAEAQTLAGERLAGEEAALQLVRIASVEAECHYGQGAYERARDTAETALEQAKSVGGGEARRQRIHLRNTIGKVDLFLGNLEAAEAAFDHNQATARELAWPEEGVRALFNLGTIRLQQRRFDEAEGVFAECLEFGDHTANPITRAFVQLNLAVLYQRTRRYGLALDAYLESLATFQQSGNELQLAVSAMNLGSLYETLGQTARARELVALSGEITERRSITYFQARSLYIEGSIALLEQDWDDAAAILERADEALEATGSRAFADRIRIARARAAHGAGNHALRDDFMAAVVLDGDDADAEDTRAEFDLYRGVFALDRGALDDAVGALEEALLSFERLDRAERVWLTRFYLAVTVAQQGDLSRCLALLRSAWALIESEADALPVGLRSDYLASAERPFVRAAIVDAEAGRIPRVVVEPAATASAPKDDPGFARWRARYSMIVGDDPRLLQVFRMVDRVSASDTAVLLQGQSGTGKELVAEAVHRRSLRASGPFIKVNCAAFVETLLLSELFGHEKGAFTGAMARKKGRFELAQGGTLFLDEIGDISPNTQVALLRVLQEKTFERVGGSETVEADVRLICATNRNLEEMVREGSFRLDLYYRLKGVVIELPPLSERRADIPLLVRHFSEAFAAEGRPAKSLSRDAMAHLVRYSWPGNVRELQNFVRSILLFVEGDRIELADVRQFDDFFADGEFIDANVALPDVPIDVPTQLSEPAMDPLPVASAAFDGGEPVETQIANWALESGIGLHELKSRLEVELIRKALVETGANITQAARMLDMTRPRLSQIVNSTEELSALRDRLTGSTG